MSRANLAQLLLLGSERRRRTLGDEAEKVQT
jgi:hypothetical protein